MSSLEISSKIIDVLLAAKEIGEKLHLEFAKNQITFHSKNFFKTMKKSLQGGEKEDTKSNFSTEEGLSNSRIVCLQMYR